MKNGKIINNDCLHCFMGLDEGLVVGLSLGQHCPNMSILVGR